MSILARLTNDVPTDTAFLSLEIEGIEVIYFDFKDTKYDLDVLKPKATKYSFQLVSDDGQNYINFQVDGSVVNISGSTLPIEDLKSAINTRILEEIKTLAKIKALMAYALGLKVRSSSPQEDL
jgi:hypothetical protein